MRKKADLTDEEKGLIAADQAKRVGASKEGDKTPPKTADKSTEKKRENQ